MSKSPNSHLFLPVAGGVALALGVGYGIATTNYGNDRIEALETSFAAERTTATEAAARVTELEAALADLKQSSEDQISALQSEADARASEAERQIASLQTQLDSAQSQPMAEGSEQLESEDVALASTSDVEPTASGGFGIGRPAHDEEIAAWDVDVLPDGRGLPDGSGDVWTGEEVFAEKCASCHGDFAEGRDAWPVLAGGFDTLDDRDPVKTVGSYWPNLSTVWDYVHRSMPFGAAGTLTDDEVYAITAYILYSNDLVGDDFTLSKDTFADVQMYNDGGFIVDDRPVVEYTMWMEAPCMSDCKDAPAKIVRRSTDVGVTPADDGSMVESPMEKELAVLGGTEWGKERVAGSVFMGPGGVMQEEVGPEVQPTSADTSEAVGPDPVLVAQGERAFKQCSACHQVGEGAKNRSGPQLNGIVGRQAGMIEGFRYSGAFQAAHDQGLVWDDEALTAFLEDPRGYLSGTKMSFRGLKDPADVEAVIAYLKTFDE